MEEVYKTIIDHFGTEAQLIKACEELSELQTAILQQISKGEKDRKPVLEEMADVYVMLEQLKIIYDIHEAEISAVKEIKLERTLRRIKEGK